MFWSKITCELKFCLVYLTTCYGVPLKVEEMVTNFKKKLWFTAQVIEIQVE